MSAFFVLCCVFAATSFPRAASALPLHKKPHIIFMLIDDLGWNDVEWQDEFGQIKSPKLSALRQDSIALDRYYVYRFCSPSRSTFLTGRYPWHLGQHTTMNLNPMPGIACGIDPKYKFISDVLRGAGYTTWALGKWHQGFYDNAQTPTYRGFDEYLGYYSGAEEHFTHEKVGTGDTKSKMFTAYDLANNTGKYVAPCLGPVGNASATYSSYLYGNETLRMLEDHDPSKPLYIYHAWNNVHAPNEAPPNYMNAHKKIKNQGRRGLAAMVSALDDQLTAIVEKLKAKGMWKTRCSFLAQITAAIWAVPASIIRSAVASTHFGRGRACAGICWRRYNSRQSPREHPQRLYSRC